MSLRIDPRLHLRAPRTRRDRLGSLFDAPGPQPQSFGSASMWTGVTASTSIASPGSYVVRTAGVTLTLLSSARGGPIRVKALAVPVTVADALGAAFDAAAATFTLSVPDEAVSFSWSAEDGAWLVS